MTSVASLQAIGRGCWAILVSVLSLDVRVERAIIFIMKVSLPLKELTVSEKIGIMEEIWSDLSNSEETNSLPEWHDRILEERSGLAKSGEVGFTDWQTAKKQIKERVS